MIKYWIDNIFSRFGKDQKITFHCNVCSRRNTVASNKLNRETRTCLCGSTVRQRSIIYLLSINFFGEGKAIKDFPVMKNIIGIELSGASNMARRLRKKFNYTNTFFHKKPYLDITNIKKENENTCDFVISSEVFEHVSQPVARAFRNTLSLLKPGGLLLLTVPYTNNKSTIEHFHQLHDYQIKAINKKLVLINKGADGSLTQFDSLIFHGGKGQTLEMRVFSESGVIDELKAAGFVDIQIHDDVVESFGIRWSESWSLPITARKQEKLS